MASNGIELAGGKPAATPMRAPGGALSWGQMQNLIARSSTPGPATATATPAPTPAPNATGSVSVAIATPLRPSSASISAVPSTPMTGVVVAPSSPIVARAIWNDSKSSAVAKTEEEERQIGNLLAAAAKGDVDRIAGYLAAGVNLNSGDYDARTALHLACSEGHLSAVEFLIRNNARTDQKDRFGHLPLDDAIYHNQSHVADYLRKMNAATGAHDRFEARLILAAYKGDTDEALKYLKAGVDPNCRDYDKRTPLHLAVAEGHAEMVKLLLRFKANPKAADRYELTPWMEAKRRHARTGTDPIHDILVEAEPEAERQKEADHNPYFSKFVGWFASWEVLIIVLFGCLSEYGHEAKGGADPTTDEAANAVSRLYPLYQDIHVMIFIGFGFLMTFLRKNGYGAVGLTFMLCAFCVQWYSLVSAFWHAVFTSTWVEKFPLTIEKLVLGDFAAGAVMITYGVVLGKVSPLQMLFTAGLELIFYSINEEISFQLQVTDIGGSMVIHMFGAFFGLAFSRMVTPMEKARANENNASGYHSDLFAMIGTVFLWLFWPSFNAGLGKGNTQHRAIINTVFALCGSCCAAFIASYALRRERRFSMVDVQNATLAGGVAMGTCADMVITPGPAIAIGAIAGFVCVFGYVHVQPFLESRIGLHDTCGVNNLHGMPSLVGALSGVIASYEASVDIYGHQLPVIFKARHADGTGRTSSEQAAYQFAYILVTLGIALTSGAIVGMIIRSAEFDPPQEVFLDSQYWEVPALEQPYHFDKRGEIERKERNKALVDDIESASPAQLAGRLSRLEQQLAVRGGGSSPRAGDSSQTASTSMDQLAALFSKMIDQHISKNNAKANN